VAESLGGETSVRLRGGDYEAVFLPGLGMLGASVKHRGAELVSLHGGVEAYRSGHTTGIPLLAPWANRISSRRFRAAGVSVNLEGVPLHAGDDGLPRHGTMIAQPGWQVVGVKPSSLLARFAYDTPELLAAFPFPHELEVQASVSARGLRLVTRVRPLGKRGVPIAFGWHPYFAVKGPRPRWRLGLPRRTHLELDSRGIPTGGAAPEGAEDEPLRNRGFDDLYSLGRDRRISLEGGGRRIELRFGAGYPYLQVFAPPDKDFVAIEPMTAPTDALVTGACPVVAPGDVFSAGFTVSGAR
jgi:galactose mutarotase-like enzyme